MAETSNPGSDSGDPFAPVRTPELKAWKPELKAVSNPSIDYYGLGNVGREDDLPILSGTGSFSPSALRPLPDLGGGEWKWRLDDKGDPTGIVSPEGNEHNITGHKYLRRGNETIDPRVYTRRYTNSSGKSDISHAIITEEIGHHTVKPNVSGRVLRRDRLPRRTSPSEMDPLPPLDGGPQEWTLEPGANGIKHLFSPMRGGKRNEYRPTQMRVAPIAPEDAPPRVYRKVGEPDDGQLAGRRAVDFVITWTDKDTLKVVDVHVHHRTLLRDVPSASIAPAYPACHVGGPARSSGAPDGSGMGPGLGAQSSFGEGSHPPPQRQSGEPWRRQDSSVLPGPSKRPRQREGGRPSVTAQKEGQEQLTRGPHGQGRSAS